ncbi:MAG: PorT family protein [Bacteroidaceae bacterium]|nr:PorT family protein [Bacteroidaceae bacterium]
MKHSLLFILLALSATFAHAQIGDYRNDLCVGVSAGVTMNKMGFDPIVSQQYHTAPTVGLTLRYTSEKFLTAYCALQVELNYARLGWTEDVLDRNSQPLPDTFKRNLDYLQLPLLARLAWGKEHRGMMFYFLVGPQIGYCIAESSERSAQWTLNAAGNPDRPNDLYAQYTLPVKHKFDYGITGGVGVELNTKLGHFLLEGRYYYGLSDVFGNAKKDVFSRSNHGAIVAKLSYLFDVN